MTVARYAPLTHTQTTFWAAQQLYPDAPLYNAPHAFHLPGDLDPDAFRRAFEALVTERDALRMVFDADEGAPRQRATAVVEGCMQFVDLSASELDLDQWLADRVRRPFDLSRPLFDSVLLKTRQEGYVWFFNQHHLITDAWSTAVLFQRLSALYEQALDGGAAPDPEAPSYLDYVAFERGLRESPESQASRRYWADKLERTAPPTAFYGVHNHRAPYRIERVEQPLGPARSTSLRESAVLAGFYHKSERVTMANMLLAVLAAYLDKVTGNSSFTVGLPHHNRDGGPFRDTAGLMLEVLPLHLTVESGDTFFDLVRRVHREAGAGLSHRPFIPDGHERPYGVVFNYHVASFPEFNGAPVTQRLFHPGPAVEPFVLHVHDFGDTGELTLVFDFDRATFSPTQRKRAIGHFLRLLDGCLAQPGTPLHAIDILSEPERTAVLIDANRTEREFDRHACFHDLFAQQVSQAPERIAAVDPATTLTYRELDAQANRIAHYLKEHGVRPDTLVGLCLERSADLVAAVLGILKAGGAFVPLDPEYPKDRLAFMCDDAELKRVVTASHLADRLPVDPGVVIALDQVAEAIGRRPSEPCDGGAVPGNLAYVIYTSGSTGRPKGTLLAHRGLVNLATWQQRFFGLEPTDAVLQFGSVSFDGFVFELAWAFAAGASLHLGSRETLADPRALSSLIRDRGITAACFPPTMLRALDPADLPSLAHVVSAGEACDVHLAAHWAPGRNFYNGYGPAESTVCATVYPCSGDESESVPIGRPVANTRVYVLDENRAPCPIGTPGELYVAGVGLARGYLNRDGLTTERFVPDPFAREPNARMYRTGDLVRMREDGLLEFVGRLDYQVKVRGLRIELEEVERALSAHVGVRACAVAVEEGQGGSKRLVAYVEDAGEPDQDAALRSFARKRLPDYMVPSQFVHVAHLPVTANGKVDRTRLPRPQGPASERPEAAEPHTALERYLAGAWEELLEVDSISVHDNFFEVGGDSIKAAMLINRLSDELNEHVYIVALFDAPTVAELAAYLERHYGDALHRLCPGADAGVRTNDRETLRIGPETLDEFRRAVVPLPAAQSHAPKNPPAAFILSPPRCGSTLLRVMLAGHPDLFAPPELELLSFNTLQERHDAFEGRYGAWLEGVIRALMEVHDCSSEDAAARMAQYEAAGMSCQAMYRTLQDDVGGRLLVDKTPSYSLDPACLASAESLFETPKYIYLQRHPFPMIQSFVKARLDQSFFRYEHPFSRRELAELVWLACNENIRAFLERVPANRKHEVRFEDLVNDPDTVMRGICAFLDVPFNPAVLEPYSGQRMVDGIHGLSKMVGDAKFHEHNRIDPNVAVQWRKDYDGSLSRLTLDLAAAMGYETPESKAPVASWRPLVRIRGGHERRPFYCVHPAGGHIFTYFHLAHHLGSNHPFYALQDPSLGGERDPLGTIEAIAEEYVEAVREAQPTGPYRLGGWSFGGYVAYEMARQLRDQGEEVSLLALFDTPVPPRTNGRMSLGDRLARVRESLRLQMAMPYYSLPLIKDILFLFGRLKENGRADSAGPLSRAARATLAALVKKAEMANVVARNSRLLLIPQAPLLRTYSLLKWHGRILGDYDVQPYTGRVTLFRAAKTMFRTQDPSDETMGWATLAEGGVDVRHVPGNHFVLLTKPYVEELASALHACLDDTE